MRFLGFDPDTPPAQRTKVGAVLALAVLGISSSAVLVRGMQADPLAIAAWRTLGAAVVLSPALLRGVPALRRRDVVDLIGAGVLLGLHFWSWFTSVTLTSILRSTLLVCLVPAWTALLEWMLRGTVPTRRHLLGLAIALPGLALLSGDDRHASLDGDLLAGLAGLLWAAYLVVGRRVRQRVDAATTMCLVCLAGSLTLFAVGAGTGVTLTGFPSSTWGLLALALAGPQLLGHQGFAYALRWVPASTLSTLMLLEPVGATLLAALVLHEIPQREAVLGGALVLAGVWTASR
ncbi:MAG: DMT family transporter [Alphaproteobacteria bacterium]|nr:DMT family transporter [Alphaproteobacteria bacterium]MCB9696036.1 DMT family transporter [Alphaproteobacteria bacterium]